MRRLGREEQNKPMASEIIAGKSSYEFDNEPGLRSCKNVGWLLRPSVILRPCCSKTWEIWGQTPTKTRNSGRSFSFSLTYFTDVLRMKCKQRRIRYLLSS